MPCEMCIRCVIMRHANTSMPNTVSVKFEWFFWPTLLNSLFRKLVGRVPIATNMGVPSSSTPYTMFGATVSLVTTAAEDLHLFRVERVRLFSEKGHFFMTRFLMNLKTMGSDK